MKRAPVQVLSPGQKTKRAWEMLLRAESSREAVMLGKRLLRVHFDGQLIPSGNSTSWLRRAAVG